MWSITLVAALAFAQNPALPPCEWCGAPEAPAVLTSTLTMPTEGEAGERLIIEGTVYRPDGKYLIETIKPGSSPSRSEPAHVHMTLQPSGEPERYIDDVVVEGDPLLTPAHWARLRQRGGSGIVPLVRGADGGYRVTRDIYLGRE